MDAEVSSLAKAPFFKRQIMTKRKPFSILKWLVFPSLSLALAATVAWFNLRAFGWEDGAIYLAVVAAITLFSIAITKYVRLSDDDDPSNDHLAVTAFIFEIVLTLALVINAAYSLSVQREMSIARQSKAAQSEDLKSVSGIRDRRAQREATRMLRDQSKGEKSVAAIFAANERPLFWIMVGELLAYGVAAFTLLAVSSLRGRSVNAPQNAPPGALTDRGEDFPAELDLDASLRQSRSKSGHFETVATVARDSALDALRDHLKAIASEYPGKWFKADLIRGGVSIRMTERRQGREVDIAKTRQSNKILTAVDRPDFQERLRAELIACGFPIEGEK
jgi:hypothetical protein